MNDQDRALLAQTLQQVGRIGDTAFHSLMRWQFIDGLSTFLTCLAVALLLLWALCMLVRWSPRGDELMIILRGTGLVICTGVIALLVCNGISSGLRDMLAPDGAAVAWILHR